MNVQLNNCDANTCLTIIQVKKQNIAHIAEAQISFSDHNWLPLPRGNQCLDFYINNFIAFVKIILTPLHTLHSILVLPAFELYLHRIMLSMFACILVLFLSIIYDPRRLCVTVVCSFICLVIFLYEDASICLSILLLLDIWVIPVFILPKSSAAVNTLMDVS